MIHTSITRNCVVFLLPRWLSAIYGSQILCVDHCILLLNHLSNHMHFITNGYKHFSKTNSTDPRQRVPLSLLGGATTYTFLLAVWIWKEPLLLSRHYNTLTFQCNLLVFKRNQPTVQNVKIQTSLFRTNTSPRKRFTYGCTHRFVNIVKIVNDLTFRP